MQGIFSRKDGKTQRLFSDKVRVLGNDILLKAGNKKAVEVAKGSTGQLR